MGNKRDSKWLACVQLWAGFNVAGRIRAAAAKEVGVENAAEETTATRIRTDRKRARQAPTPDRKKKEKLKMNAGAWGFRVIVTFRGIC